MLQVVTIAEQCFSCWQIERWAEAQKQIQCLCTSDLFAKWSLSAAKDGAAVSSNDGQSPTGIKTVVRPADRRALGVDNHAALGPEGLLDRDRGDVQQHLGMCQQQASIAQVKAVVGSQNPSRRNPNVVWQLPGIVNEAQAAILRKIATLVFRLDRRTDIQLVLRVAVSAEF